MSASRRATRRVQVNAGDNIVLSVLTSGVAGAVVAAVTTFTNENRDKEIERLTSAEGVIPIAAAVGVDAVVHSIPVLGSLVSLVSEPVGAAAGVAYLMSILLSSPSVDPNTLAPKGGVLNAEKVSSSDSRSRLRVPFTRIVPTALEVIDTTNKSSDGSGWSIGADGLPKLPLTSVLVVLGVGGTIVELISHAPVLSLFMPRVLQVAAFYAASGAVLDKRT